MASERDSEAAKTGYGVTNHPDYPYHAQFGADTYYPGKVDNDEMRRRFQAAATGMRYVHAFCAAWASNGSPEVMRAWDEFNRLLNNAGIVGFGGKNVPYRESVFRPLDSDLPFRALDSEAA